jgi:chemotaxis protein CheD
MTPLKMQIVHVGSGKLKVSGDPEVVLTTESLCPSLAVSMYDPHVRVGGMLHLELPDSSIDPANAKHEPGRFADTGIPLLIEEICRHGAQKPRLETRLTGGATGEITDAAAVNAAKRNYLAVRKTLWKEGVIISAAVFGGTASPTTGIQIRTGALWPSLNEQTAADTSVAGGDGNAA